MPNGIDDYYQLVQQPWGRIFYDILWRQLDIAASPRLQILDYGSGFGVTANYYAKNHEVTAIEPDIEMSNQRYCDHSYTQITGGLESLSRYREGSFDVVLCHNVLEYTAHQQQILAELARVTKPGGILSIIKHNFYGRAMAAAVFDGNPGKALELLNDQDNDTSTTFGNRFLYRNEELLGWSEREGMSCESVLGIRAFYGLSRDNEVKYSQQWYENMLELELRAGDMEEFKHIAFFSHLIFKK